MCKTISIIGGDERIIQLAKLYSKEKNKIYLYGFEQYEKNNQSQTENKKNNTKDFSKNAETILNIENCILTNNLKNSVEHAEIIISSIPFSKDNINIYAPYSKEQIKIKELIDLLQNKTLIAGSISNNIIELTKENNINVIDLMKQEDLTILNTIATAEGTISEIILNTKYNIHGSKILILGFGRVAKTLAKKLLALDAEVTCSARKNEDFAWMEAFGLKNTNINFLGSNLQEYDIIINTVPQIILDESKLKNIKKETLLIDLASKPGGIDFKICEELGLKYIWALAIPGKVAPITSAQYIKKSIDNIFKVYR